MRKLKLIAILPVALAALAVGGGRTSHAAMAIPNRVAYFNNLMHQDLVKIHAAAQRAAITPQQASTEFDIESQGFHCQRTPPCFGPGTMADYAGVAAVGFGASTLFHNGQPYAAPPDAATFVCGHDYVAANGDIHTISGHSFPGFDPGELHGVAKLDPLNPTETNTNAYGNLFIYGFDSSMNTQGFASGTMFFNNTDNQGSTPFGPIADTPVSGSYNITISGTLTDMDDVTGATTFPSGQISCRTGNFNFLIFRNPDGTQEDVNEAELGGGEALDD
jgi:hypothetical protein